MVVALRKPKNPIPAHLRRSLAILRSVDDQQREAKVVWRKRSFGTWGNLNPSYSLDDHGIRLRLRTETGILSFRVAAVHWSRDGAEIIPIRVSGSSERPLLLRWREDEAGASAPISPDDQRECLISWMRLLLPDSKVLSIGDRCDRANSLSGSYFRIRARAPGRDFLILAARSNCSPGQDFDSALSQALLWDAWLRRRRQLSGVPRMHLVVPADSAAILQHRSALLSPARVSIQIWQYDSSSSEHLSVESPSALEPPRENREFRWPVLGPFQWSADLARVLDLAPSHIRRHPRFQEYDSLRLWGLEFATARGEKRDCITFGVGPDKTELGEGNFEGLRILVDQILYFRRPDSPDPRHPLYRLQAERWLESLILEDTPRLFPELMPESVYSQIPVYLGKDPGRVDILGADREGTLVILELKVSPDPDLPIQALDYWGRVVRHNQDGDFLRRGYFSGIPLNRRSPKLYLVSPVFSFHDSTEKLLGYFNRDLEVWKISINEDWRCGVRVLRRTRLQCGGDI